MYERSICINNNCITSELHTLIRTGVKWKLILLTSSNYVRPRNTLTEMYAGRVACCPLVSHVEYKRRAPYYG